MQVVLIGGFAGMEKKHILCSVGNELVARDKKVVAVIIEDMQNNDEESVSMNPAILVREMMNIPCTFITDLVDEMPEIYKQPVFDYLLIEVPFSLPPGKVKKALVNLELKDLSFAPVIYVFDVNMLRSDAKMIPKIIITHIIESEIIFANANPADQKKLAALNRIFEGINTAAKVVKNAGDLDECGISGFVDMIINWNN
jgi:G3E family GTPase